MLERGKERNEATALVFGETGVLDWDGNRRDGIKKVNWRQAYKSFGDRFVLDGKEKGGGKKGGVKEAWQVSDCSSYMNKQRRGNWKKTTLEIKIEFSFKHIGLEFLVMSRLLKVYVNLAERYGDLDR